MLNGWLLGKGQAVGMAIATGALLFTLAALEQNGYHTWQAHPSVWLLASTTSAILVLGVLISTGMANSIQTQYQELSELSRTLEQRVQERTAELSATVERLKQTQLDLVQSEKMAALGSLVAGVSHELNTPIGNGLTVASTMQHQVEEFATSLGLGLTRSALDRFVANIREGADILMVSLRRAAALVSSFKQVAVDQTSENRREFGLRETVNEILLTLGPTIRKTSHMVTSAIPDGILMESYPGPLGQVLTNLIHNALTHGLESRSCGQIHLHAVKTHSDWVQLTVHDDGSGISAEHMSRVFDPFFTTRLGRGGSGLGLSIVYNIVTQTLGGSIRAESTPGHGASFILDIPLAAPSTPER
jgi:signal transduction histidine kinase